MSAMEKIKAAAAELNPDEQVELFRWWVESDTFKQRHLAALKREIAVGLEDLERGRYQTYTDATVMQLAEDIGRSGRDRLTKPGKDPKA
jgi:hypothetical protein